MPASRREFLWGSAALAAATGFGCSPAPRPGAEGPEPEREDPFEISLAEWSLHRRIFSGKLDHLDFAVVARRVFGLDAVEYVNQFFRDRAADQGYLAEMKRRADGEGVRSLLIMCDGLGALGDPDPQERTRAIENHYPWVEAAKALGCHSIRVNAASEGEYEEQISLAADGLRRLTEFGDTHGIGVIVENHGGLSSNGAWLATVMRRVDHPNCGTLPDFGNFRIAEENWYDRYQGVEELMPFAKAVSAKSHDFDEWGEEIHSDYARMLGLVTRANYHGYIGIEYEGEGFSEYAGIVLTKNLLERLRRPPT